MRSLFSRKLACPLGLGALITVFAVLPSAASAAPPQCGSPEYSQPFAYAGDENFYVPLPGQSLNDFEGEGWELSGGASVVTTTLSDGSTGQVLNLPSGSKAVSPQLCVTKHYPTARAIVRNVAGAEGVAFEVSYEGSKTEGKPKNTGQIHGTHSEWTLVTPVNMQPEHNENWQRVRITLVPGGKTSDFQVYDLYVDPRMR
jgi:hypothetical protein